MTDVTLTAMLEAAVLTNPTDRGVMADACEDAGRPDEAALLRDTALTVFLWCGRVVPAIRYTIRMQDEQGSVTYEELLGPPDIECGLDSLAAQMTAEWVREGDWGNEGASVRASWVLTRAGTNLRCRCGEWTGEECSWDGPPSEMVVVEYMPEYLRASHQAAGNSGSYPANGAVRVGCSLECAFHVVDAESPWAHVVEGIDPADHADVVPLRVSDGDLLVEIEPNHEQLIRDAVGNNGDSFARCCGYDPEAHDWTGEGEGGCKENPGVWSVGGTSFRIATHCRDCGLHRVEHSTGSQRNPGEHDRVEYEMPNSWCSDCQSEDCPCEFDKEDYAEA